MADQDRWNEDRARRSYQEYGRPRDYGSDDFESGPYGREDRTFGASEDEFGYGGQSYRGEAAGARGGYRSQSPGYETERGYRERQRYGGGRGSYGQGYPGSQSPGGAYDGYAGQGGYGIGSEGGYAGGSRSYGGDQRYGASQGYASRHGYGGPYGDYEDRDDHEGFLEKAGRKVGEFLGHRGRGPKNYTRSDERIRDDVNDRLTDDAWLDASEIEVLVKDGEVTLSGAVSSRDDKRRAEDLADQVSGAKHVQNNLRVQPQGETSSGSTFGGSTATGASAGSGSGSASTASSRTTQ